MRNAFAADPRSSHWQIGFNFETYAAQPSPPIAWKHVPVSTAVKWCDAVHLTWTSKNASDVDGPHRVPKQDLRMVGFLAEKLGSGS